MATMWVFLQVLVWMLTNEQAVLTPSATGEAPGSRATTGSGTSSTRTADPCS
jgi:hypothetical protein